VSPNSVNLFLNSLYEPSYKKRKVRPRDVVLSITSATSVSSSPKYNLLPILIFLAGSTNTSQRRCSSFNSLNKYTSILAPVFSLLPYNLAGNTLILFIIITSPSSKDPMMSLNSLCSIVCFFLSKTIKRDSSLFSAGYSANNSSGKLNPKCDNFIYIYNFYKAANIRPRDRRCQVNT